MLIDFRNEDNHRIIQIIEKRLDAASALEFKERISQDVETGHKNLIIDLSEVDFIDSSGLGSLVAILKSVSADGSLSLTGLHQKTEQIFKLTRMDTIFSLYPTVTEALEAA